MKAIGYYTPGSIERDDALVELDLSVPAPGPRDLLVRIKAVSVNPADTKVRASAQPAAGQARVLGFDAAGIVEQVGSDVTLFSPGDEVFYAGDITRPGSNSELHLVDERIVGRKPASLDWAQAAAMPLTSITAWELLFDRLRVPYGVKTGSGTLLVINGAGGVGSMLIQLARRLTGLTVVATASRPETAQWCRELGAHHIIDHHRPMAAQLRALDIAQVEYVAGLTATDRHLKDIAELMAPHGTLSLIDDPESFDINPLKRKAITVAWELMFTRPIYKTEDMIEQHRLLTEVAALVDAGVLRTTLTEHLTPFNVQNLKLAHAHVESGRAIGKTVLPGF